MHRLARTDLAQRLRGKRHDPFDGGSERGQQGRDIRAPEERTSRLHKDLAGVPVKPRGNAFQADKDGDRPGRASDVDDDLDRTASTEQLRTVSIEPWRLLVGAERLPSLSP